MFAVDCDLEWTRGRFAADVPSREVLDEGLGATVEVVAEREAMDIPLARTTGWEVEEAGPARRLGTIVEGRAFDARRGPFVASRNGSSVTAV